MQKRVCAYLTAAIAAAGCVAALAQPAGAAVVRLANGQLLGVMAPPGATVAGAPSGASPLASPFSAATDNLLYNGGPVLHTSRPYLIFWDPGHSLSALSRSVLVRYLEDVASPHASAHDVYGVLQQYTDEAGPASQGQTFSAGQAILDTHPYPAELPFCPLTPATETAPATTACVSDEQIQREITRLITDRGLPTAGRAGASQLDPNAPIYYMITPVTTDVCFGAGGCAYNNGAFCAYHSFYVESNRNVLYSPVPFVTMLFGPKGCQSNNPEIKAPQFPNNDPAGADTIVDNLSHENSETITDPLINAWFTSNGFEVGDQCEMWLPTPNENPADSAPGNPHAYTPVLGGRAAPVPPATWGTLFDQLINGGHFYTQTEWSNAADDCRAAP